MDDIDRQLLIDLQRGVPFQMRPFEALGKRMGLGSAEVILRVRRLQDEKVMREITAVFDRNRIAYQSALIAMKVAEETVDAAAAMICRHPGVPLCCKRRGEFNLWFILALPLQESLEEHGQRLEQFAGAQKIFFLKTLKVYKPAAGRGNDKKDLTEGEIQLVRLLQQDFPLTDEPFRKWAQQAGLTEEMLFRQIQGFQKNGFLKRFAARVFREKAAEQTLVMWQVPEEIKDTVGRGIASFPEVQVCVERTACAEMPYSLHAGIEGVSEGILKKIEQKIGLWPSQCFFKEKDYKKSRLNYFSEEIQEWRNHFMESQKMRIS